MSNSVTRPTDKPEPATRYDIFISYSHGDEAFAERLQRELQKVRLTKGGTGRRLRVFRDKTEASGAGYRSAILEKAAQARKLLILCNKNPVGPYVEEEITVFSAVHDDSDLVPVLAPAPAGTPASFPEALLRVTDRPLAPDFRRFVPRTSFQPKDFALRNSFHRQPFANQWFQLLATLLEQSRSDIEQRELRRWRRRLAELSLMWVAIALLAGMLGTNLWRSSPFYQQRYALERGREIARSQPPEGAREWALGLAAYGDVDGAIESAKLYQRGAGPANLLLDCVDLAIDAGRIPDAKRFANAASKLSQGDLQDLIAVSHTYLKLKEPALAQKAFAAALKSIRPNTGDENLNDLIGLARQTGSIDTLIENATTPLLLLAMSKGESEDVRSTVAMPATKHAIEVLSKDSDLRILAPAYTYCWDYRLAEDCESFLKPVKLSSTSYVDTGFEQVLTTAIAHGAFETAHSFATRVSKAADDRVEPLVTEIERLCAKDHCDEAGKRLADIGPRLDATKFLAPDYIGAIVTALAKSYQPDRMGKIRRWAKRLRDEQRLYSDLNRKSVARVATALANAGLNQEAHEVFLYILAQPNGIDDLRPEDLATLARILMVAGRKDEAIRAVSNLSLSGDLVPQLRAAASIDPSLADKMIANVITTAIHRSGFDVPSSWNDLAAGIHQTGREKTAIAALEREVSQESTYADLLACSTGFRVLNQHDKAVSAALKSANIVLSGPGLAWEVVIPEVFDHLASLGVSDDQVESVIDDGYGNSVYGNLGIARAIRHGWPKTARKLANSIAAHADPNSTAPEEVCSVAAVGQFSRALSFADRVDSDWRLVAFSVLLAGVSARNNPPLMQRASALICSWPSN